MLSDKSKCYAECGLNDARVLMLGCFNGLRAVDQSGGGGMMIPDCHAIAQVQCTNTNGGYWQKGA